MPEENQGTVGQPAAGEGDKPGKKRLGRGWKIVITIGTVILLIAVAGGVQ